MLTGRMLAVLVALAVVIGGPFVFRELRGVERVAAREDVPAVIVVTPHVPQIREEFGEAFERWHQRVHGEPARVDWRAPGGTAEIRKQLEAQYSAAFQAGRIRFEDGRAVAEAGVAGYDVLFGGGSFEHSLLKRGLQVEVPGSDGTPAKLTIPMSVAAGLDPGVLSERFSGVNEIGAQRLYDPEQHWIGTALSGFGIMFNRDVLRERGIERDPEKFADLTDHRYTGLLALADPRQSGSITTTLESILNKEGWERGWRILRELAANARYFSGSATRPPLDVSSGEAAAGLAIDFYGRGQAQAVTPPGQAPETARVGYVDPKGAVYIDADPISVLLGAPHPELARRFVEFTLSDEAQALWQMAPTSTPEGRDNPEGPDGRPLGPRRDALRRMPVVPSMYERYLPYFVDRVNPFELAIRLENRGWRDSIGIMMGAFGIDSSDELRAAWRALQRARASPGFPAEALKEMEAAFYAMPTHTVTEKDGTMRPLEFNEANYSAISADAGRWRDPGKAARARIEYTSFFRDQYRRVLEIEREAAR